MHDNVAKKPHWFICKQHNFECNTNWQKHIPEAVLGTDEFKLL